MLVVRTLEEVFAVLEAVSHAGVLDGRRRVFVSRGRGIESSAELAAGIILLTQLLSLVYGIVIVRAAREQTHRCACRQGYCCESTLIDEISHRICVLFSYSPFAGYCVEIVVLYVCALEARLAADDIPVGGVCSVAATLI